MKKQNILLCVVCVGMGVVMMSYTLIAPFVPGQLLRRDIDPIYNGIIIRQAEYILSVYSVISMILSPFIASYFIPRFKYFKLFVFGFILTGFSMMAFGFCYFISNNSIFIVANVLIRMIQGIGMATTFQVGVTMLTIVFQNRMSQITPVRMVAANVGLGVGPSLGGLLFSWLGYLGPFLVIGSLILLISIFLTACIKTHSLEHFIVKGEEAEEDATHQVVTYLTFCKIKMSLIGLICIFVTFQLIVFYEPILADRLQIDFGYNSDHVAYFFSIYTVSAFVVGLILILFPIKTRIPYWAALALILGIIGLILMGPSNWLGLPDSDILIGIGLFFLSSAVQLLRVSSIVLILHPIKSQHPSQIRRISKLLAVYNEIIIGMSFLVTPLYSAAIYKALSYEDVCNILAVVVLGVLILLILVTLIVEREEKIKSKNQLRKGLLEEQATIDQDSRNKM